MKKKSVLLDLNQSQIKAIMNVMVNGTKTINLGSLNPEQLKNVFYEFQGNDIISEEIAKQLISKKAPLKILLQTITFCHSRYGAKWTLLNYVLATHFDKKTLVKISPHIDSLSGAIYWNLAARLETFKDLDAQISAYSLYCDWIDDGKESNLNIVKEAKKRIKQKILDLLERSGKWEEIYYMNSLLKHLSPDQIEKMITRALDSCKKLDDYISVLEYCIRQYNRWERLSDKTQEQFRTNNKRELLDALYKEKFIEVLGLVKNTKDILKIIAKIDADTLDLSVEDMEDKKYKEHYYYQEILKLIKEKFYNKNDLFALYEKLEAGSVKNLVFEELSKIK